MFGNSRCSVAPSDCTRLHPTARRGRLLMISGGKRRVAPHVATECYSKGGSKMTKKGIYAAISCMAVTVLSGCAPGLMIDPHDPGCTDTHSLCIVHAPDNCLTCTTQADEKVARRTATEYCLARNYGPPILQKMPDSYDGWRGLYEFSFRCSPSPGSSPSTQSRSTYQQTQPTFHVAPQSSDVGSQPAGSAGSAPCSIGDGYQTVRFSDGAVYSGSFKSCRPLAGPAQYQQGSTVLNGYAEPVDDRTVRLRSGNSEATITLQIR
jgi:hypothetical protein